MAMDITLHGSGAQDNVEAQVDSSHGAVRISPRPLDHIQNNVLGGHYSIVAYSGSIAASLTGASVLFACRFVSPSKVMVLKRLAIGQIITTAYTTLTPIDYEMVRASSFTVGYSVNNGTALAPAAYSNKARDTMAPSDFSGAQGSIVPCTTAGMTTATITLDSAPCAYASPPLGGFALGSLGVAEVYSQSTAGRHPFVFSSNQGFIIRSGPGNTGATGVSKLAFIMEWAEVASY